MLPKENAQLVLSLGTTKWFCRSVTFCASPVFHIGTTDGCHEAIPRVTGQAGVTSLLVYYVSFLENALLYRFEAFPANIVSEPVL